jgi:hypothetical protein
MMGKASEHSDVGRDKDSSFSFGNDRTGQRDISFSLDNNHINHIDHHRTRFSFDNNHINRIDHNDTGFSFDSRYDGHKGQHLPPLGPIAHHFFESEKSIGIMNNRSAVRNAYHQKR